MEKQDYIILLVYFEISAIWREALLCSNIKTKLLVYCLFISVESGYSMAFYD